jgi:hypothetical protein
MVKMAVDPFRSTLTRRFMLLTLPLVLRANGPIRVELFLATACPISNRYIPEINRIARLYQPKGVSLKAYFPEPDLTQSALDQWARAYAPALSVHLDTSANKASKAGATLTPEAAVFQGNKLLYRGRIDDRYVSWGKSRPAPTRRDLVEVLDQLLTGKIPQPRFTKAWGCFIENGAHP